MSKKRNARHSRPGSRRGSFPKPDSRHKPAREPRSSNAEKEILQLVRTGVEKFILRNATVEDFLRTIRAASIKEEVYSHQLTKSVFTRIVKEAIRKRNLRRSKYPQ